MHTLMRHSKLLATAWVAGFSIACHAGQGLATPAAETWWPQWQARLSLQGASLAPLSPLGGVQAAAAPSAQRGIQGVSLLGDYYFARPAMGHFRASGGLMVGALGGAPVAFGSTAPALAGHQAGSRLGLSVLSTASPGFATAAGDTAETVPYLGVGYSGMVWRDSISLTADLGMVSERPAAASGVGRALFGNQGMNQALREMRLSPVLQLGMRYSF